MRARNVPDTFLVAFSLAGEQRSIVRPIVEAVEEALGPETVFFDEWFEHYIAGADADLRLQELYGERSELAVVCVSERYGGKPWTLAEYGAIRARQMKARGSPDALRVLPIRVGDGEVKGILFNDIVPDVRGRRLADSVDLVVGRLRLIDSRLVPERESPVADGWPDEAPLLQWPMADHTSAREAFAALLRKSAASRYLALRGPTGVGKSRVTQQMLANALARPGLACGRFDFKGTTDIDAALRAFVQELGLPLPPQSARVSDRLASVLDVLRQRPRPTLLIFDTYEAASPDAIEWVEKQLLPALIRATWLRVVIAGQRTPESRNAIWGDSSSRPITLSPPSVEDWFAYSQQHRPEVKRSDVETACRLAADNALVLDVLLGPRP